MSLGKLRFEDKRLAQANPCFLVPALLQQRASKIGECRREVGLERQSAPVARNRLVEARLVLVGVAKVEMRVGCFRPEREDLAIAVDCFVDPALLLEPEPAGAGWTATPATPSNTTELNGAKLTKTSLPLRARDQFRLGDVTITFADPASMLERLDEQLRKAEVK